MFKTVGNGQSIRNYVPAHLRRIFYNNPAFRHASHSGRDPLGVTTNGLVFYLPLWALSGSAFKSIDATQTTSTCSGTTHDGSSKIFASGDYIELESESILNFTSGAFSIILGVYPTTLAGSNRMLFNRGLDSTDGYFTMFSADGRVYIYTAQSGVQQASYTDAGDFVVNNWYTVGFSRSGNSCIIYKNGVNANAVSGNHTNPATSARTAKIGIYDDKASNPFIGSMVFVAVYNRALGAEEHLDIHNKSTWLYR